MSRFEYEHQIQSAVLDAAISCITGVELSDIAFNLPTGEVARVIGYSDNLIFDDLLDYLVERGKGRLL